MIIKVCSFGKPGQKILDLSECFKVWPLASLESFLVYVYEATPSVVDRAQETICNIADWNVLGIFNCALLFSVFFPISC